MTETAKSLNKLGHDLLEAGRLDEAEQAYLRAIEVAPSWHVPWFNAGLACKRQRRWADCARYNLRSAELDPDDGAAWWNLGIAATALGDWALARKAWRGCGIEIPGDGPPAENYGEFPIRINPDTKPEVVWCRRIDPARAVIVSVPLPGSGHAEGDTVLHDGTPNGYRVVGDQQISVFDELAVLERSGRSTIEAWIEAPDEADVDVLEEMATSAGIALEDWTRSIRRLCKACSEGVPHQEHAYVDAEWVQERHLGTAARSPDDVRRLLAEWASGTAARRFVGVCATG